MREPIFLGCAADPVQGQEARAGCEEGRVGSRWADSYVAETVQNPPMRAGDADADGACGWCSSSMSQCGCGSPRQPTASELAQ